MIFICTFDPFGKRKSRYTFENVCREVPGLRLNDGAVKVFFNTKGDRKDVSPETEMLLDYLENRPVTSELTQKLNEAVEKARLNEKWRLEYMKERLYYEDMRKDAYEEAYKKVYEEVYEKGEKTGVGKGETKKLVEQICRKLRKEKEPETIAEELEEDISEVRRICSEAEKYKPDYDVEKILQKLSEKETEI